MKHPVAPTQTELQALSNCIPKQDGTVYVKLFCDGSWTIEAEFQTVIIASISSSDLLVWDSSNEVIFSNPDWLPECEEIVKKIRESWEMIKNAKTI